MRRRHKPWAAFWTPVPLTFLLLGASVTGAAEAGAPVCAPTTAPTGRVYSVAELVVRFTEPNELAGLLRNLRVALDEDLLLQPAFYNGQVLQKIFGDVRMNREETSSSVLTTGARQEITTLTGVGTFHGLSVKLTHSCFVSAGGSPRKTNVAGAGQIEVAALPNFTVARVREVLGREAASSSDYGFHAVPKSKGRLVYVRRGSPVSGAMPGTSRMAFMVKLDPKPTDASGSKLFSDTEVIDHIEIFQAEH